MNPDLMTALSTVLNLAEMNALDNEIDVTDPGEDVTLVEDALQQREAIRKVSDFLALLTCPTQSLEDRIASYETFLTLVKAYDITQAELQTNINRRPSVWLKFADWIPYLPA